MLSNLCFLKARMSVRYIVFMSVCMCMYVCMCVSCWSELKMYVYICFCIEMYVSVVCVNT